MKHVAKASRNYQWRPAVIAAACLIWGALCIKDGYWTYPAQREAYLAYTAFVEQNPQTWPERWEAHAAEQGLPLDPQDIKERSVTDIWAQWAMLAIVLPIGLIGGYKFLDSFRWSVTVDEQGLHTHNGRDVSFDQITGLDKTRWDRKGIAYVLYKDASGKQRRILLDDWKYEREPTQKILETVEAERPDVAGSAPAPAPAV